MPFCPMVGWYTDPERDYAINSAITGSITVTKTGRASIATDKLQTQGKHLECVISGYVKKILETEAEDQPEGKAWHYGLIIVRPGKEKLSDSEIVDFISFHRDPKIQTKLPSVSRNDISAYNKVFEDKVLKELAVREALPPEEASVSTVPPPILSKVSGTQDRY